ncbi:similar to Saccharomyces cerevisiae YDR472W TRS31 One of 10 subunits of the transport protein particle (TRAPP) complex of the cis-Golgi which mediates vesicle docking and fusion [Maudiozyma saulgeensis]|uniref:Similar to Saccharomyces cerevisiae YDR472W TRS31 One of 10 subunits of the transport protein particle (TRAPP) complex of the cis-Golgi which mediates vesicle docking and fusion n=1 Tax=Maudiozyma saulgeensis TaxID=1789683 RepID=A0A1X7RAL4_9SACH|nr:similar to Saccharomyces cerevisiae YDR472W TRS31 One of 10 subunits of the transport protein particle (TRAPP) complex of the cis-Golgi which mediates vesicle docking and fusion [Kazachstania saulgeensis]
MSQDIIYTSTSDESFKNRSTGYEYTVGPKPSLPDEYTRSPLTSKLYSESLNTKRHEVSLAAMTFLFQEMISALHKECKSVTEFETKLSSYGESIGSRLLELLNFRSSISPGSSSRTSTFLASSTSVLSSQTSQPANNTNNINNTNSNNSGGSTGNRTRSRSNTGTSSKDNTSSTKTTNRDSSDRHHHHHQVESLTSQISKMRRRDLKILDILQFIHGTLWSYLFNHVSDDLVKSSERNNEYMIIDNQPPLTQFISGSNNRISCDYFICGIIKGFLTNAGFRCKVTAHEMPQGQFDSRTVYLIQFDNQVLEREAIRFGQS